MEIPPPAPNDIELRNIIDKLADFVARNGPEFESMTKSKQRGNPKFAFLYGGEYYNYYQYKVITKQAMMKQQQQQPQPNMSLPPLMGQHGIPPLLAGFAQQPPPQAQLVAAPQQHQQQPQAQHPAQLQAPPNPNGNSSNTMPQIWSNPPPVNAGPANPAMPMSPSNINSQLTAQLEALTKQQQTLSEQIRQSEMNLTAQHGVLLQQQQVQIEDALTRAQEEMLMAQAKDYNISLLEFDSKLQPIIDSCTKDSISNGKGWILQHCTDSGKCQIISQYLLRNIRKNADELKKCLESAVIPMFCNAKITANEEQRGKLTKLLSLWESKGNFFDACVISKLKSPPSSLQEYQTSLMTQHANVVAAIHQATKTTFENYQQQHQAFVQHATQQIALLEKQKQQHLEQHARKAGLSQAGLSQAPPPLLPELMAAVVGASSGGNSANGAGVVLGVPGGVMPSSASSVPPQLPVGDRGGPGVSAVGVGGGAGGQIPSLLDQSINFGLLSAALQKLKNIQDNGPPPGGVTGGPNNIPPPPPQHAGRDGDGGGDYTQPPPNFPIPDLSRPPPNFQYGTSNPSEALNNSNSNSTGGDNHQQHQAHQPHQQHQPHQPHQQHQPHQPHPPQQPHQPQQPQQPQQSHQPHQPHQQHQQHQLHQHHIPSVEVGMDERHERPVSVGLIHDDRDMDEFDHHQHHLHQHQPPPDHQADEQLEQQQTQEAPEVEPPPPAPQPVKIPYFELPAGLMVPLIRLEDFNYHPLDSDEIRLPPPTPTNDRLMSAVEAFYSPPSHERPRDGEGWEKLALYEYFKVKNASRKQKEDELERGVRDRSRSPSPIDPDLLKATKKQKKRTYRSKSRSRSRSRSRSPADHSALLGGLQQQQQSHGGPGGATGLGSGNNRSNQRHHRNHRSGSRSRSRSRSRSPSRRSPSSGSSVPSSIGRRGRSRSPQRRGGGGGGGSGGSDRDHRDRGAREVRRSPTPPSFGSSSYAKVASSFLEESSKPMGSGHHMHHLQKSGGASGGAGSAGGLGAIGASLSGSMGGDRIGLGATIEPLRHEAHNPADPYESFRKNKGAAFITRMKARADERN